VHISVCAFWQPVGYTEQADDVVFEAIVVDERTVRRGTTTVKIIVGCLGTQWVMGGAGAGISAFIWLRRQRCVFMSIYACYLFLCG